MFAFIMFLITALLAGLKVAGYIVISWWLVFAPAMFWAALVLLIVGGFGTLFAIATLRR